MPPQEFKTIIAAGEGETLEFKREPVRAVGQDVAAFSSSRGGTVLVGVAKDGTIVGVGDFEVARGQVQNWIHEFVFPAPAITTSLGVDDGHELVIINVEKGDQAVYFYRDRPYYRNGESSQTMTAPEVQRRYDEAGVQSRLRQLGKEIEYSHPARHIAAGIVGQGDLATMNYRGLLERLIQDLRPHFEDRR